MHYLKGHFILDVLSMVPFVLDLTGVSNWNTQIFKKPHGLVLI